MARALFTRRARPPQAECGARALDLDPNGAHDAEGRAARLVVRPARRPPRRGLHLDLPLHEVPARERRHREDEAQRGDGQPERDARPNPHVGKPDRLRVGDPLESRPDVSEPVTAELAEHLQPDDVGQVDLEAGDRREDLAVGARVEERPLVEQAELEPAEPEHARAPLHVEAPVEEGLSVGGPDVRDAVLEAEHVVARRSRPGAQRERPAGAWRSVRAGRGGRREGGEGEGREEDEGRSAHVGSVVRTAGAALLFSQRMVSLDPVAFVRGTPPFDALPLPAFEDAAKALDIAFYPAQTRLLVRGGEPSKHLYVIRKGAVRLEREAQTLQVLEEGEVFGFTSLISGKATIDVTVEEDLLAYRLPKKEFEALLAQGPFAGHFASGLAERLRNSLERSQVVSFQPDLAVPVSTLLRGPAVRVPKDATVGEAARLMADRSVSSVLVDSEPPGIVTDRDFRRRVLAAGRGPETPVLEVYSAPLKTVSADCPIYEAWRILLDAGCHHLPVTRNGAIIGVLSATDLLKCTAAGPVAVMKRVERLGGRDALPGYSEKVVTDQDNALVWGEDVPGAREYFAALAEKAIADLVAAGFPRCPGGYMSTKWLGGIAWWEERFRGWLRSEEH